MRWTQSIVRRCDACSPEPLASGGVADGKGVCSWRPWAGAKRAGDDPLVTVTMRSRTPGRARYKPYTIAQGRPADPVEPVVTNSCASLLHTRLRVQPASGLPCALCSFEGHRCRFP